MGGVGLICRTKNRVWEGNLAFQPNVLKVSSMMKGSCEKKGSVLIAEHHQGMNPSAAADVSSGMRNTWRVGGSGFLEEGSTARRN